MTKGAVLPYYQHLAGQVGAHCLISYIYVTENETLMPRYEEKFRTGNDCFLFEHKYR
jgi:hypothetical protein